MHRPDVTAAIRELAASFADIARRHQLIPDESELLLAGLQRRIKLADRMVGSIGSTAVRRGTASTQ
jgi:hypothetical protein